MMRKHSSWPPRFSPCCFMAADSVWACKFLDNLCSRCRRPCNPAPALPRGAGMRSAEGLRSGRRELGDEKTGRSTIRIPPKVLPNRRSKRRKSTIRSPPKDMPPVMPVEPANSESARREARRTGDGSRSRNARRAGTAADSAGRRTAEESGRARRTSRSIPEPPKNAAEPRGRSRWSPNRRRPNRRRKRRSRRMTRCPNRRRKPAAEPADELIPEPPKKPKVEADDSGAEPTPPAKPATEEPEDDAFEHASAGQGRGACQATGKARRAEGRRERSVLEERREGISPLDRLERRVPSEAPVSSASLTAKSACKRRTAATCGSR